MDAKIQTYPSGWVDGSVHNTAKEVNSMFTKIRCYLIARRITKQMRQLAKLRDTLHEFNAAMKASLGLVSNDHK